MTARVVERRIVTVLFADLVGFTALSERLDAEDVSLIQDSYYARIVVTATHLHLAAAGLEPPVVPRVEERLPSFDLDHAGPSWLAAIEIVVGSWLDAGDYEGAGLALDRMRA